MLVKKMVFGNQDKWRKHPVVSKGYRAAFPGLRNAVVIFGAYLVIDYLGSKIGGGGGHGHGGAANVKPVPLYLHYIYFISSVPTTQ